MKTKTNKGKLAILLLLFTYFQIRELQAQNSIIDSLRAVLSSNTKGDTNRVNTLNNLSKSLISESKLDSALICAKSALDLAKTLNYKRGMGYAYNRLGNIYDNKGNSPEALQNYHSALKIKEELGDKRGLAWTYQYIANLYNALKNYNEAIKYAIIGKKIMNEVGDKGGEITCYNSIGSCYANQGKYKEALDTYFITLKKSEEINDDGGISLSYINIGDVYLRQGNYKECLKNQFSALKIAEKTDDKYILTLSYINIGICYKNFNQLDKAEEFCLKGLNLAKEIYDMGLIRDSQKSLSEIYTDMGNTKKAFEFYKYFIATRDSFINESNTKKTTELEMNYQFDKKQQIMKIEQEKRDAVQKVKLYSAIFGVILSLIVMVLIFNGYKRKQKDNLLLTKQKEELNEKNRIIEDKQNEILASIRYAKHIQISLMPTEKYIEKSLSRLKND